MVHLPLTTLGFGRAPRSSISIRQPHNAVHSSRDAAAASTQEPLSRALQLTPSRDSTFAAPLMTHLCANTDISAALLKPTSFDLRGYGPVELTPVSLANTVTFEAPARRIAKLILPVGAHIRNTLSDDACSLPAYIHRYRMVWKRQLPFCSESYRKYNNSAPPMAPQSLVRAPLPEGHGRAH